MLADHLLYTVEQSIGFGGGGKKRLLVALQLFQIGHHDDSVEAAFPHFEEVHLEQRVASTEVDVLSEEHRCVAMGVEREDRMMHTFRTLEQLRFIHDPGEDIATGVPGVAQTFGMPLHSENRLVLRGLHGLYHSVGRPCRHSEARGHLTYGLVMERVDGQLLLAVDAGDKGVWRQLNGVR